MYYLFKKWLESSLSQTNVIINPVFMEYLLETFKNILLKMFENILLNLRTYF